MSLKARLNPALVFSCSFFFVLVYFVMDARFLCCGQFSLSVLSQEIGLEERLRNDVFCVGCGVKP